MLVAAAAIGLAACGPGSEPGGEAPQAETAAVASPEGDALVPGTNFHATGSVRCAMTGDASAGMCAFGVTREGNGNGMVTLTKPDGRTRVIFFEGGEATGADVSEADPGEFSASREVDTTTVHIGTEWYEIPDAVIMGG